MLAVDSGKEHKKDCEEQSFFVSIAPSCAAAGGCAATGFDRLHDLEALAEALVVHDLALAQKVQRLDDLAVRCHVHQVLVGRPRFLFRRHVLG